MPTAICAFGERHRLVDKPIQLRSRAVNTHSHCHCHSNSYCYCNTHRYSDGYVSRYRDRNTDLYSQTFSDSTSG